MYRYSHLCSFISTRGTARGEELLNTDSEMESSCLTLTKMLCFHIKKKKTFLKVENITCGRSNDNLPRLNEQDTDRMHSFVEMNT